MGYPGFLQPPTEEQSPSPLLPQPPSSGGGFWATVVDLLRNTPISIGDRKVGRQTLPSFNQMTAGRRLLDFGRAQGLELPQTGSVSPDEAQFMVQQGLQRRQQAPLGMDMVKQLMVPEFGEPPERMTQRAWLAQLPRSALGPLVAQQVQQYGLPGWGGEQQIDPYAALKGLPGETEPAPSAVPSPAPRPTAAPATLPQPGAPSPAPSTAPLAQTPPQAASAPIAAPSTATMPALATQTAPGLPQTPAPPSGRVTQEQVLRHSTVTAAQAAYDASRTLQEKRQNAIALRTALAQAPAKIQQEQHQRYSEQSEAYRNQLAAQKAYQEATRAPYGYGADHDAQIRMDYNLQPGQMPTPAMAQESYPRMVQRLEATKAGEAAATTQARLTTEEQIREQQPLVVATGGADKAVVWRDPKTGFPLIRANPNITQAEARQVGTPVVGEQGQHLDDLLNAMPIVERMNYYVQQIYGPGGVYASMSGDERRSLTQGLGRALENVQQRYPIIQQAQAFMEANAEKIARAIGGIRGAGTEGDVRRSKALFPELSSALGLRWEGWKPNVSWDMPDTRGLALRKINDFNVTVDTIAGRMLNNPTFQHPGLMPRLLEPGSPGAQGGQPPTVGQAGRTPTTPGVPTPPPGQKAMPNDQRAVQAAYQQLGITTPPHAGQQPQAFEQFLLAVRTHLGRLRPGTPPQQLDQAVGNLGRALAQQQGAPWPPAR